MNVNDGQSRKTPQDVEKFEGSLIAECNYATQRLKEYEQFIKWLNDKPEYRHVYQQYLQQKYP